jgi:hypothetical protein
LHLISLAVSERQVPEVKRNALMERRGYFSLDREPAEKDINDDVGAQAALIRISKCLQFIACRRQ